MLNLIVGVLAVVVMIAAGMAGLTYLGPAYMGAQVSAHAAQFLNSTVQIEGAQTLAHAEGASSYVVDVNPGDAVGALVGGGYLQAPPAIPSYAARGAAWNVVANADGRRPIIVLPVDESNPEAMAVCNELKLRLTGHAGCTADLSTLSVPN